MSNNRALEISEQAMKTYLPLPVTCDFSSTTLGEAVRLLGPSFIYDITVNPLRRQDASHLLKKWGAEVIENPLAPHYNLHVDDTLLDYEWFVTANGKSIGSAGV